MLGVVEGVGPALPGAFVYHGEGGIGADEGAEGVAGAGGVGGGAGDGGRAFGGSGRGCGEMEWVVHGGIIPCFVGDLREDCPSPGRGEEEGAACCAPTGERGAWGGVVNEVYRGGRGEKRACHLFLVGSQTSNPSVVLCPQPF